MIVNIPILPNSPQTPERLVEVVSELINSLYDHLSNLSGVLNGQIESNNLWSYSYTTTDSGTADTEITIVHGLGRIPTVYAWNIDRSGVVYDSRRNEWTENVMYIKCSVANAKLNILVMR